MRLRWGLGQRVLRLNTVFHARDLRKICIVEGDSLRGQISTKGAMGPMKFKALDAKVKWEVYMDVDTHPTLYKYQLRTQEPQFFFHGDIKFSKFIGILIVARTTILTYAGCAFKGEVIVENKKPQKGLDGRDRDHQKEIGFTHAELMDFDLHLPDSILRLLSGIYEMNHKKDKVEIGERLVLNSDIARNYKSFRSDMIGLMSKMEEERKKVYCSKRDQMLLQKREDLVLKPSRNTAWKIRVEDV